MKENRKYVSYDTRFVSLGLDVLNMIILTEIENLSKLERGCYISDSQLGELIRIGRKNTNERINYLARLGYIKCETKYIKNKRRRTIKFLLGENVLSPQGTSNVKRRKEQSPQGDTEESSTIEVKSPQGNLTQSPEGNPGQSPKGNNNKLIEVERKEKIKTGPISGPSNIGEVFKYSTNTGDLVKISFSGQSLNNSTLTDLPTFSSEKNILKDASMNNSSTEKNSSFSGSTIQQTGPQILSKIPGYDKWFKLEADNLFEEMQKDFSEEQMKMYWELPEEGGIDYFLKWTRKKYNSMVKEFGASKNIGIT